MSENTSAPALLHTLSLLSEQNCLLMSFACSGADELSYGIEKYNWNFLASLADDLSLYKALEKNDVACNLDEYKSILNSIERNLLREVIYTRNSLYKRFASITPDI